MRKFFYLLKEAIRGSHQEYTTGNINKAIFLLSVPMVLEMVMESLFAVVDIFFVSRIGIDAVATVGLTESVLTLVYSVAIGISMGATAVVARRVGENAPAAAGRAIGQTILISLALSVLIAVAGVFSAREILRLMGASPQVIAGGSGYTTVVFASAPVIVLLYSLCGALRGAGYAAAAMRSLWLSNGLNILLCPVFIFGFGPIPAFGVTGAALATTLGRGAGVVYQLFYLVRNNGAISLKRSDLLPELSVIKSLLKIAGGGMGQFLISSASWVFLTRILSEFGSDVVAGYTIAIRVIIFTLMPASGIANASATLVGQNLGAGQPERAETSVWRSALFNMIFLVTLALLFFVAAEHIIGWFTEEQSVITVGVSALQVLCLGYGFYAYGMVIIQSFNGAGDTRTPTYLNLFCFWALEIPLAYLLAVVFKAGPVGVFAAVPIAESILALLAIFFFRKGRWKTVEV